ncbi:MAG: ribosomal small subunit protein bTHX [Lysobacterales bacterium 69-70]|jgi:ribosomal small subunit protein bTHX|nr:30S ribosomal protein THX [Xanthomonadaceae bacterium]ODU34009.1 MAG: ribosomal small subunit protein bTHX [Xanthomonadaceae bacterium SCN 69-320]ODV18705.1 MAG: ribosomal small subunit protein bTHX [Xanthomonadaceae bacterium SCN 69-25]OJY93092.1 MAG: ribosomal small subunit protein bTHX [Xanthomonadales bacterium 69-70]
MGKGDKKTRKGKTYSGSYGNIRPHGIKTDAATKTVSKTAAKKAAPAVKKPAAKKPAA